MIERYTLPEMKKIWSDEHRFEIWLKIELLALEAQQKLGLLPQEDLEKIKKGISFSPDRMQLATMSSLFSLPYRKI